ncbi:MAG: hypothetical protein H5T33_06300 [Candidatus Methanosuratus sp.]|nr:hypothetical protein [Candidatus Methanosuratincola sp.]
MIEKMTSLERARVALNRGVPDVVPVFSRDLTFPLDVVNYTTPEVCRGGPNGAYNGEKSARAVIAAQKELGHDVCVGSIWDLGLSSDAYGGITDFPEQGIPMVKVPAFGERPEKIDEMSPLDFRKDGRYPGVLKSYEIVSKEIGNRVGIAVNIEGPVTEASMMRGTEKLVFDMMIHPDIAKKIIDLATTNIKGFIKDCIEGGANWAVFLASSNDGTEILTPELMRKYSLPNITTIVEHAKKLGYPVVFHPHGIFTDPRNSQLVDESIATGIAGFQFAEKNDFKLAKEKWGSRVCILGGVDIATAILPGPVSRIEDEVKLRLKECASGGGYIVMASCSLHRKTPIPHVKAMVDATHRYGVYPLHLDG